MTELEEGAVDRVQEQAFKLSNLIRGLWALADSLEQSDGEGALTPETVAARRRRKVEDRGALCDGLATAATDILALASAIETIKYAERHAAEAA